MKDFRFKLIPIFSDVIAPDAEMAAKIAAIRAPHEKMLGEVVGRTETLLYRRGNFNGTLDDVICDALLAERDAEIALSPGFRWGNSLLPGQDITREDIYNATALSYPAAYRMTMTGVRLKEVLEDVADNLFNPDPYYQQGGDMVRVGGMQYAIAPYAASGRRITRMELRGKPIEATKTYTVAGWAPVSEEAKAAGGEPVWDVAARYLRAQKTITPLMPNLPKLEVVAGDPGLA